MDVNNRKRSYFTKSSIQNICHTHFSKRQTSVWLMRLKYCIGHLKFMVWQIKRIFGVSASTNVCTFPLYIGLHITPNHSTNGVMVPVDSPSKKQTCPWDFLQSLAKWFIMNLLFCDKMKAYSLVNNLVTLKYWNSNLPRP